MKNSYNSQLNENMIEISRTLHNLKHQQRNIINDIDDEEIYKEKIITRLEESKKELKELNGILTFMNKFLLNLLQDFKLIRVC